VNRVDFQSHYEELKDVNGIPSNYLMENLLKTACEERREYDISILAKWLKLHKILPHVRSSRLLEVCRKMKLLECPAHSTIICEGDPGDAFYVILEGICQVHIKGAFISDLTSGCSFGEKALENNAPRSATVTSCVSCKLMVVTKVDYNNIALCAQGKFLFMIFHVFQCLLNI
jgi:CRP-like cAMP-binding protein